MLRALPLLALPIVVYALVAIPSGGDGIAHALATHLFTLPLVSSPTGCPIDVGQLLLIFAIACLFFELLKSTSATTAAMIDISLAVGLFIVALIAFLVLPAFGTGEFFLLLLMCLLDFMAGFVVMVSTSRRTVDYTHN